MSQLYLKHFPGKGLDLQTPLLPGRYATPHKLPGGSPSYKQVTPNPPSHKTVLDK